MNLANLAIKRPIFITCVVVLSLAIGVLSLLKLPVDMFPNVTFPVVVVTTVYRGAGPEEIETLVSRPLEEELSSLGGIKTLKSINKDSVSTVVAEFTLETDVKYAEQQVRDRVSGARRKLPDEAEQSVIRRIDPADQPILIFAVAADLPSGKLFDLVDQKIKPKFEQVPQVGLVEIVGGRKREILVELDRKKLKDYEISVTQVAGRIKAAGQNVPGGRVERGSTETVVRTLGEFKTVDQVKDTIVNFAGNDVPVDVGRLGSVRDTLAEEKSRAYVNGRPAVLLMVFRQSGANTIAVANNAVTVMKKLNEELKNEDGKPNIELSRDGSKFIRANVTDVSESIQLGILLTIFVVFFFLGSIRSTIITGLALPNSLIGAFILMAAAGFSVNIMTLLALSLAVGLLIDDAIVVRENIFRHVEMGKSPIEAALAGTKEVTLAVVATTLTVIAVFGPIAFLKGVVGQFFKEFGLTVCFAMAISLFDALTMAPMLSAYYAGTMHDTKKKTRNPFTLLSRVALAAFEKVYGGVERVYARILRFSLDWPIVTLGTALLIFVLSLGAAKLVPKTFLPAQDSGEFAVGIDLPPGTSLERMSKLTTEIDALLRERKDVTRTTVIVGERDEVNKGTMYVQLVPSKQRKQNTSQVKEEVRTALKPYAYANPAVKDIDYVGGGQRPFNLNIVGTDLKQLEGFATQVFKRLKDHPALKDVDISYRPGKPEFQVDVDLPRAERLGVSSALVGQELRAQIDGIVPAVFREGGREYDIRVRLTEDQRDLMKAFNETWVPNINGTLVRLSKLANPKETTGLSNIDRQDRGRFMQISADLTPGGPGIGGAMDDINKMFATDMKLPVGMSYRFEGQAENFRELTQSMAVAAALGVLFIYLVLASLYESFIFPLAIMLVLPLAACGAFYALFVMHASLDLFSMIGCIMLLGIATKNSILLVDYTLLLLREGKPRREALIEAGKNRLRPILMTSFALIAGMLPIALGLNEASKQRTSLGIAVIGGIISSTLLTLVVVPAAFSYIDRFRIWSGRLVKRLVRGKEAVEHESADHVAPQGSEVAAK